MCAKKSENGGEAGAEGRGGRSARITSDRTGARARGGGSRRGAADARPHRGTCGARIRVICTCEALILMSDPPQVSQCQTTQRFYGMIRLIRWGTSRTTPPARAGTSRGAPPPSGDVALPCATHAHARLSPPLLPHLLPLVSRTFMD